MARALRVLCLALAALPVAGAAHVDLASFSRHLADDFSTQATYPYRLATQNPMHFSLGVVGIAALFATDPMTRSALAPPSFVSDYGLRGPADVAGLPLLLLAAGAVSLAMVPAANAWSRAYERSADRFALEMTRNPGAFISAMKRLGAQNLAEDDPSRLTRWLFYSHPSIKERIEAAEAFKV